MNTNTQNAPEREEIEHLLPWHAAGTLSRRDAQRVEEALARDPELKRQFALVREELSETILVNETLGAPSARAMERLMAGIEAESGPARQVAPRVSFFGWVAEQISALSPRTLGYAATAATLAIVLQFGALTGVLVNSMIQQGDQFETASYRSITPAGPAGSYALIGFASDADAGAVTAFLEQHNLSIVDGPRAGGIFRVRIAAKPLPKAEADKVIEKLRGESKVVRFIAPTE